MLRICGGSGQRPFAKPFINVDLQAKWNPDVVGDIRKMPMFDDGTADLIVYHHAAEHLHLEDSRAAFAEANRILATGGSLLVFVPNLRALTEAWIQGRIDDYIFCVNIYGAYMGDEADTHKWGWSQSSLLQHLNASATWSHIKPFDWRKIPGANIAGPDFWILATEAVK